MKIVTVACDAKGNIDVNDLKTKAEEHASELCGLMVTYPSTHGVFESRIREIVDAVHDAGGQVYMDGANMNAQVGLTNPGYIGADVCHLNLHKTFAMPHGGGGPGVGPICVAAHLRPFLPSHPIAATGGDEGITAVASAPWGSALLLPITYGYIKMLGGDGLRRATEMAIVNANYMSSALAAEYRTYYSGETGRVGHEMILDLTNFKHDYGIDCGDIAHRLMDYGFHAPTLSFPVHETLMVEPTESEPKAEMDRFMEALVHIKRECEAAAGQEDNVVRNAPHTAVEIAGEWSHPYSRREAAFPLGWIAEAKFWPYVSKIDNGYGDRNLVCRCTESSARRHRAVRSDCTVSSAGRRKPRTDSPKEPYSKSSRRHIAPCTDGTSDRTFRLFSSRWSGNPIICTIFAVHVEKKGAADGDARADDFDTIFNSINS